jgi:hypothetical protein
MVLHIVQRRQAPGPIEGKPGRSSAFRLVNPKLGSYEVCYMSPSFGTGMNSLGRRSFELNEPSLDFQHCRHRVNPTHSLPWPSPRPPVQLFKYPELGIWILLSPDAGQTRRNGNQQAFVCRSADILCSRRRVALCLCCELHCPLVTSKG